WILAAWLTSWSMTSVMKSPNMMSTIGRIPVIAAPSPMPVMPASEIGESRIRSAPNSSTRPESTLKGVPASATSSPIRKTDGSRRSSSPIASLTAWERVNRRVAGSTIVTLGEDMLVHLARIGIGRRKREPDAGLHLLLGLASDFLQRPLGHALLRQPARKQCERIAPLAPLRLLLPRAVVAAIDVADVMSMEAIRAQ